MIRISVILLFISALLFVSGAKVKSNLSEEEQAQIVKEHNKWRSQVNVADIAWSDELAIEAQKWANHLVKSGCRGVHSNTTNGENIYWSSAESTPKEVVDDWASEIEYYKGGKINSSKIMKYGHYTQVVWYNTTEVGCGRAKCKNGSEIWVCTYAPSGNYIGEKPY